MKKKARRSSPKAPAPSEVSPMEGVEPPTTGMTEDKSPSTPPFVWEVLGS